MFLSRNNSTSEVSSRGGWFIIILIVKTFHGVEILYCGGHNDKQIGIRWINSIAVTHL